MLRNGMRVLIIDDQPQVRSALRLLLCEELGVTAVGEAGDLAQALELIGVEQLMRPSGPYPEVTQSHTERSQIS